MYRTQPHQAAKPVAHMDWAPARGDGYLRWSLPSSTWSGGEWSEDTIDVVYQDGFGWSAHTEHDQCTKRDLEAAEVASVRAEFGLDRYVAELVAA